MALIEERIDGDNTGVNQIYWRAREQFIDPNYYDTKGWRYDPWEFMPKDMKKVALEDLEQKGEN